VRNSILFLDNPFLVRQSFDKKQLKDEIDLSLSTIQRNVKDFLKVLNTEKEEKPLAAFKL